MPVALFEIIEAGSGHVNFLTSQKYWPRTVKLFEKGCWWFRTQKLLKKSVNGSGQRSLV
jgi:hypothetical protein